jgi:hypothetical protein
VSVESFTFMTTIAEEGRYLFGVNYVHKSGAKVEIAYPTDEAWYLRTSKPFKTDIGTICPEFRLDVLPDDKIVGIGLGIFF